MLTILAVLFIAGATIFARFRLPLLAVASAALVLAAGAAAAAGLIDADRAFLAALLGPGTLQLGFFCGALAFAMAPEGDKTADFVPSADVAGPAR